MPVLVIDDQAFSTGHALGKNPFVVLLIVASSSKELEPSANAGRFQRAANHDPAAVLKNDPHRSLALDPHPFSHIGEDEGHELHPVPGGALPELAPSWEHVGRRQPMPWGDG